MFNFRRMVLLLPLVLLSAAWGRQGWDNVRTVQMKVRESGARVSTKTFTLLRDGENVRVEGIFPCRGAFADTPHVELQTAAGSFVYAPALNASLELSEPFDGDRLTMANPVKLPKDLFTAPKEVFCREYGKPARLQGQEKIADRTCWVVLTSRDGNSAYAQKLWIDDTYGLVLKSQSLEQGNVVAEREVLEFAVNQPIAASQFSVPAAAQKIPGIVSPQAFEKINSLGGDREFLAALQALAVKQKSQSWVAAIALPEGMKFATSWSRPPIRTFEIRTVRTGRQTQEGSPAQISLALAQQQTEEQAAAIAAIPVGSRTENDAAIQQTIAEKEFNQQQSPEGGGEPNWVRPQVDTTVRVASISDGMFVSEFIGPSKGTALVLYQSNHSDPTSAVVSRSLAAKAEQVQIGSFAGKLYEIDRPFQRFTLVWQFGSSWLALTASGLSKEELLKVAATARGIQ